MFGRCRFSICIGLIDAAEVYIGEIFDVNPVLSQVCGHEMFFWVISWSLICDAAHAAYFYYRKQMLGGVWQDERTCDVLHLAAIMTVQMFEHFEMVRPAGQPVVGQGAFVVQGANFGRRPPANECRKPVPVSASLHA